MLIMESCKFQAPNGEPSLLHANLTKLVGERRATKLWLEARSLGFQEVLASSEASGKPVQKDKNGEPLAEEVISITGTLVPKFTKLESITAVIKDLDTSKYGYQIIVKGATARQIARQLQGVEIPKGIVFSQAVESILSNPPGKIIGQYEPVTNTVGIDPTRLQNSISQLLVQKTDGSYFTLEQQQDVINAMLYTTRFFMVDKGLRSSSEIIKGIYRMFTAIRDTYARINTGVTIAGFEHIKSPASYQQIAEEVLLNFDQFFAHFSNQLRVLGIDIKNPGRASQLVSDIVEAPEVAMEDGKTIRDWSQNSFELDPRDSASAIMKMFISTIPIPGERTIMNTPKLADFDRVYQEALGLLSSSPVRTFDAYVTKLSAETGKPMLVELAKALQKAPDQIKNEFVRVMSMEYTDYKVVNWNSSDYGVQARVIQGNRYSIINNVIQSWQENQKLSKIMETDARGERVMSFDKLVILRNALVKVIQSKGDDRLRTEAEKFVKMYFDFNGIIYPQEAITDLLDNIEKHTAKTDKAGGLRRQFSITQTGKPMGIFSALITGEEGEGVGKNIPAKFNPMMDAMTSLRVLAKVYAKYSGDVYSISHLSIQKKNIWDYTLPSFLSSEITDLKSDPNRLDMISRQDIALGNFYLEHFKSNPAALKEFDLAFLEGIREAGTGSDGRVREEMSDREQDFATLALFTNQGRKTANMVSVTHAEKTRTPVFTGVPKIDILSKSQWINLGRRLFVAEYKRVTNKEATNDINYEQGKKLFYFLPQFNYDQMTQMVKAGVITQEEKDILWNADRTIKPLSTAVNGLIDKLVNRLLNIMEREQLESWIRSGIVNPEKKEFLLDDIYRGRVLSQLGFIFNRKEERWYLQKRNNQNEVFQAEVTEDYVFNRLTEHVARDYTWNRWYFTTTLSPLLYGDPAQFFKNGKDDVEKVQLTMQEYEKRLAKDIAPGQQGAYDHRSTYRSMVMEDMKTVEEYAKDIHPAFGNINATDAQEFITVREHLDTLNAYGEIDSKTYNEMIGLLETGQTVGTPPFMFYEDHHKEVLLKPSKPVQVQRRDLASGAMLIDYVKSSAIPLYAGWTAGKEIDKLRVIMEQNNIQRAVFKSGKKVGNPVASKFFNADGTVDEKGFNPESVITMKRSSFRIQQENPYDGNKKKIGIVSQMHRLLTEGIQELEFGVKPNRSEKDLDRMRTGKTIIEELQDTYLKLVNFNVQDLKTRFGIDDKMMLTNPDRFYDWLHEMGLESKLSSVTLHYLKARKEGKLVMPLAFNPEADKLEKMLMSSLRKLASVQVPGRSFVQASSAGINRMVKGGDGLDGVRWIKGYDGGPLKTLRIENGVVKPAQVILPLSFLTNRGLSLNNYMVNGDIDPEKFPPELLQLVMARIPNQGHSSMLPAEIVGFAPDSVGDTIFVPAAITTQMGSDFDIDKLYIYSNAAKFKATPPEEDLKTFQEALDKLAKAKELAEGYKGDIEQLGDLIQWAKDKRAEYNNRFQEQRPVLREWVETTLEEKDISPEMSQEILSYFDGLTVPELETINESRYKHLAGKGFKPFAAVIKEAITEFNSAQGIKSEAYKKIDERIDDIFKIFGDNKEAREAIQLYRNSHRIVFTPNPALEDPTSQDSLLSKYFDLHWEVLTHKQMVPRILSPLDKTDLKTEAIVNKQIYWYSPVYQNQTYSSQRDAKMMVAFTSSALVFNNALQNLNLKSGQKIYVDDHYEYVNIPVKVLDETTGEEMNLVNLSGRGNGQYYEGEFPPGDPNWSTVRGDQRTKHTNIMIQQTEAVDHAKNRTIDKINLSSATWPASYALSQLSTENDDRIVSLKFNARLLKQEIIQDYAELLRATNDTFSDTFTSDAKSSVKGELIKRYSRTLIGMGMTESEIEEGSKILFSPQSLKSLLDTPKEKKDKKYYLSQIAVLNLFSQLDGIGERLTQLQGEFNHVTKGVKGSILEAMELDSKLSNLSDAEMSSGVIHTEDLMYGEGYALHSEMMDFVNGVFNPQFLYQGMEAIKDEYRKIGFTYQVPINTVKEIYDAAINFQWAAASSEWITDPQAERANLVYDGKLPSVAKQLAQLKVTLPDNALLKRLNPVYGEHVNGPDIISFLGSMIKNDEEIIKAWADMLTKDDTKEFAVRLAKYAILNASYFRKFIPADFILQLGIADKLGEIGLSNIDAKRLVAQYIQHNPNRATRIDWAEMNLPYEVPPVEFTIPPIPLEAQSRYRVMDAKNGEVFASFLSIRFERRWVLYTHTGNGHYTQIDTLNGLGLLEYTPQMQFVTSILPENRSVTPEVVRIEPVRKAPDIKEETKAAILEVYEKATLAGKEEVQLNFGGRHITQVVNSTDPFDQERVLAWAQIHNFYLNKETRVHALPSVSNAPLLRNKYNIQDRGTLSYLAPAQELSKEISPVLQWIGITKPELNQSELMEVVKSMADRKDIPNYVRVLAEYLVEKENDSLIPLYTRVVENLKEDHGANISAMTGDMTIWNRSHFVNSKKHLPELIVHELLHRITAVQLAKYMYPEVYANGINTTLDIGKQFQLNNAVDLIQKMDAKLDKDSPVMKPIYKEWVDLYQRAREHYINRRDATSRINLGFDYIFTDMDKTEEERVSEFIVQSISRPGLMRFLNQAPAGRKNLFDKLIDLVDRFIKALADILGGNVNKDSMLYEAIKLTFRDSPLTTPPPTVGIPADPVPDGQIILAEGFPANAEQTKAVKEVDQFLATRPTGELGNRSYVISGAGGTGKTSVLRTLADRAVRSGIPRERIVFVTPTHVARLQLLKRLKNSYHLNTIHSELRIIKDEDQSELQNKEIFRRMTLEESSDLPPTAIEAAELIFVDESSMISDELMAYLQEAIPAHAVVVFAGDHAQLGPIQEDSTKGTTSLPFRDFIFRRGTRLINNERAKSQDIAYYANLFRKNIDLIYGNTYRKETNLIPSQIITERVNTENVTFTNSSNEFGKSYLSIFDKDNPTNQVMITFRNDARNRYNTAIRRNLFGVNVSSDPVPGDHMMVLNEYKLGKENLRVLASKGVEGVTSLQNGARYILMGEEDAVIEQKIKEMYLKLPVKLTTIKLEELFGNAIITIPVFDFVKLQNQMKGMYNQGRKGFVLDAELTKFFGVNFIPYSSWKNLIQPTLKGMSLKTDYAYAVTSHKSQGAEFNHVYVDETDIMGVMKITQMEKLRSLYTGISRTKEKLTVLGPEKGQVNVPFNAHLSYISSSIGDKSITPTLATEEQAENAERLAEGSDFIRASRELSAAGFTMSFAPGIKDRKLPPLDRAIKLLKDQVQEIRSSITDAKGQERTVKYKRMLDLQDDIEKLSELKDMAYVAEVGKKHLGWIEKTLKDPTSSDNEVMSAYRLSEMWANIIDALYTDTSGVSFIPDTELEIVNSRAQTLRLQVLNTVIRSRLISASKGNLKLENFSLDIKDMGAFASQTRSLAQAVEPLASQVALTMQTAARWRDEDVDRLTKELEAFDKEIKGIGGDNLLSSFVEVTDDGVGLIGPYSPKWYQRRKNLREKREKTIESALALTDAESRKKMINTAWKTYWRELMADAVMIDIRRLFNVDNGEDKIDENYRQELVKSFGEQEADDLIDRARRKLRSYLSIRDSIRDQLQADIAAGNTTEEEARKTLGQYIARESPFVFMNNRDPKVSKKTPGNRGEHWTVMVPKPGNEEYYSKRFKQVMENDKEREAYSKVRNLIFRFRKMLPAHIQRDLPPNFFPHVPKGLVADTLSIPEYIKTLPQQFIDDITAEYDADRPDAIPIRYLRGKPENASTKVIRVLEVFGSMATHYKWMSQVKDMVDMAEASIREIDRSKLNEKKPGLRNTIDAFEYMRDTIMYRKPKALEGNTGLKVYSLNPLQQRKISARIKELLIQKTEIEKKFAALEISFEEYNDQLAVVDEELSKYEGQTIYGSRIGDKLISINQLKALSYNPFSAFANIGFGLISYYVYANGRQDFDPGTASKALWAVKSSTKKWLTFGAAASPQAMKIVGLMDRLNILGDVVDSQYGKTALKTRRAKWRTWLSPFSLLRSTDYMVKASTAVAMAMHHKVTVNGKEISLWEALDDNAEWNVEKYGEAPGWYSKDVSEQVEWDKFRNRATRVAMIIMGNQDKNSPKLMNRKIFGRLIGQFRLSWMPEGWFSRFEDDHYDPQLDRQIRGRYRTAMSLGWGYFPVIGRQLMSMFTKADPFSGVYKRDGKELDDTDKANMRRNLVGLAFTMTFTGAGLMLKHLLDGGDDDDDNGLQELQLVLNLTTRLRQDLLFYSSPEVFDTVTRNLIPASDVITDYIKLFKATGRLLFDDDYEVQQWLLKVTKAGLPIPQATLVNKVKFMTERDIDDVLK